MKLLKPLTEIVKLFPQYSLAMLMIELATIPIFVYSSGTSYFLIRNLLGCSSFACYRFALITSLIPGSFFTGVSFAFLQQIFKIDYSSIQQLPPEQVQFALKLSTLSQRERLICLFALSSLTISISNIILIPPRRKSAKYYIQTLPLRMKTKKRNLNYKIKNSYKSIKQKLTT